LFFSHIPWIFVRLVVRLLRFDGVYALALASALIRVREIAKLRSNLAVGKAGRKPLEDILAEITN
jgi:hypothetical protein